MTRTHGSRALAAEFLGTTLLLAAIIGSGIMAERLAGGNVGLALLANSLAVGAALVVLVHVLGPVSDAHLNPAVTLVEAGSGDFPWRHVPGYWTAQFLGAMAGVALAHLMFDMPYWFASSTKARSGLGHFASEMVATFGLILVVRGCAAVRSKFTPFAVGAYIMSAFWFTASTSFANPAVTLARSFTDTFTGIRPQDAPAFWAAQFLGAAAAGLVSRWLFSAKEPA
ncbi:MAG: aquaporin family protein [Acidobacteriales bacterium]|nr:aquaporin family protein [Terriglobales bacterium]